MSDQQELQHIFISYRRAEPDKTFAYRLADDLRASGHRVWIDVEGIEGGEVWNEEIQRGIDQCYAYVVILSPDSLASRWVRNELLYTLNYHTNRVRPVMFRDVRLPPELVAIQYVDFQTNYDSALRNLLKVIPEPQRTGPSLPDELLTALQSQSAHLRRGAVETLFEIAKSSDQALAALAREHLWSLSQHDPNHDVRYAARALFESEQSVSHETVAQSSQVMQMGRQALPIRSQPQRTAAARKPRGGILGIPIWMLGVVVALAMGMGLILWMVFFSNALNEPPSSQAALMQTDAAETAVHDASQIEDGVLAAETQAAVQTSQAFSPTPTHTPGSPTLTLAHTPTLSFFEATQTVAVLLTQAAVAQTQAAADSIQSSISIGQPVEVYGTEGNGAIMRFGPGITFAAVVVLSDGVVLLVEDIAVETNGLVWWRVRDPNDDKVGWIVESYVRGLAVTTHVVEAGETIASIAVQYSVTVDEIKALNDLDDSGVLFIGQKLLIMEQ